MHKNLFKQKNTDIYLLNQSDFSGRYQLIVETEFNTGEENVSIKIKKTIFKIKPQECVFLNLRVRERKEAHVTL